LPQSKLFRIEIKVKMCSGHLHTLGIIPEFILIAAIISRWCPSYERKTPNKKRGIGRVFSIWRCQTYQQLL